MQSFMENYVTAWDLIKNVPKSHKKMQNMCFTSLRNVYIDKIKIIICVVLQIWTSCANTRNVCYSNVASYFPMFYMRNVIFAREVLVVLL